MLRLLCFFTLLSVSAFAQEPIFQSFEVDSAAAPRGGLPMLDTYLRVNVRKPFMAQVANVTGRVTLKAVVEPDGRVSDVQILRGVRPDCDREAVRAFRLFAAWKPALKDGKAVRQAITYPVMFRANAPLRHENGKLSTLYNANAQVVADPAEAKQAVLVSVDTLTNVPNGDLVICKVNKGEIGKETARFTLIRETTTAQQSGEEPTVRVGHKQPDGDWVGTFYTFRTDGTLLSTEPANRKVGEAISYAANGVVERLENFETRQVTHWFANGQLKQIQVWEADPKILACGRYQVAAEWDSSGRALVSEGNGHVVRQYMMASHKNGDQKTLFTEEGSYRNGHPDGIWKGQTADGSYSYEERYDQGKCLGGSVTSNGQVTTYDEAEKAPEFVGGAKEMYMFLAQTLRYPVDAQRGGIMGKVFVSFTVCTDGSLCDFSVVRGVHPALDEEALRVVKKMNKRWRPGLQRGKPVRVKYNLPLSFQLG